MQNDCIGSAANGATAPGYPTAALKTPTGYTGGIYEAWSISLTPGDNTRYALWDSGEKPPTTPRSTAPPTAKSP